MRLPIGLTLGPWVHCDLPTVPDHLAGEMGTLIVAVSAAVEALPGVGRVQLAVRTGGCLDAGVELLG